MGWRSLAAPLAAAMASTLVPGQASAACPQLLQNSEFNNGDTSPWEAGDDPPEIVLRVDVSNDQYKTLDVSVGDTSAFSNPSGSLSQSVDIHYGERYRVSFYMYNAQPASCHVSIGSATSPATTYGLNDSFTLSTAAGNATQQFTFVANADDPDALFNISFPLGSYTYYKFDSLFIEDISSPQCNGAGGQGGGAGTTGSTGGTGGATGFGGNTGTGGASTTGGATMTGGSSTTGGASGTGGRTGAGGASTGGVSTAGGTSGTGAQGGAGGAVASGGASVTGGASGIGGSMTSGGTSGTAGSSGTGTGIGGATGAGGTAGVPAPDAGIPDAGAVSVSDASAGASVDSSGNGPVCVPGTQISCACPGAASAPHGVQVCDSRGASYGACVGCPDAGGATPASHAGGGCSCSLDAPDRPRLWWVLLLFPLARWRRKA